MKIDIIIPTYKPDKGLFTLIERLEKQTIPVHNIIIMNTEEKYFEKLIYGTQFFDIHKQIKVYHVSKKEFDHGKTRHKGILRSKADVFVMMTQDAIPADEHLLEELIKNLKEKVAVAYGRQIPDSSCNEVEKYSRAFNYPAQSRIKTEEDLPELGIKTYFCSNVCAAYRRELYEELGGFCKHIIFNEDMVFAASVIKAGYGIAYEADAKVIHSHNYTNMEYFHRNFDLGVSQISHPEVFAHVPSESEGKKLVKKTSLYLKEHHMSSKIPKLYIQSAFKYAGYFFGKHYHNLPRKCVIRMSMNKEYWNHEERKKSASNIDPTKGYGQ